MKRYTFGKAFSVVYSYETVSAPSADNPSIAVYSEKPSKADARLVQGDAKIGSTIATWATGSVTNTKTIAVPAIVDPLPDDVESKTYYVAVNYTLAVGGQSQLVIMPFLISKAVGTISGHELVTQDVIDIFPTISDYIASGVISTFLTSAIAMVKRDLLKRDLRFEQAVNQDDFKYCLALKAISLCSYSQFITQGDQFYVGLLVTRLCIKRKLTQSQCGLILIKMGQAIRH